MAPAPLTSLLTFASSRSAPSLPPAGSQVVITDTLACPATFLLLHFAKVALSPSSSSESDGRTVRPVVWTGCDAAGLQHLTAVCRRSGLSLPQLTAKGLFKYIDATEALVSGQETPLKALCCSVRTALEEVLPDASTRSADSGDEAPRAVVIIDDVSSLAWALPSSDRSGHGATREGDPAAREVGRWTVALRNLCQKHSSSLVTLQHVMPTLALDSLSSQLFTRLFRASSLWIEVKELTSGRARDCAGDVTVHPLAGSAEGVISPARGRAKGMLFNIANDGSVVVWPRGTQGVA